MPLLALVGCESRVEHEEELSDIEVEQPCVLLLKEPVRETAGRTTEKWWMACSWQQHDVLPKVTGRWSKLYKPKHNQGTEHEGLSLERVTRAQWQTCLLM